MVKNVTTFVTTFVTTVSGMLLLLLLLLFKKSSNKLGLHLCPVAFADQLMLGQRYIVYKKSGVSGSGDAAFGHKT